MPEPNIQKSEPLPGNPNQPEPTIIPNDSAALVALALENGRRLIEAANKQ